MNLDEIDAYLTSLSEELRKRGVSDVRFVEEARGHLIDAVEREFSVGSTTNPHSGKRLRSSGQRRRSPARSCPTSPAGSTVSSSGGHHRGDRDCVRRCLAELGRHRRHGGFLSRRRGSDVRFYRAASTMEMGARRRRLRFRLWPSRGQRRFRHWRCSSFSRFHWREAYAGMALRRALLMRPGSSSEKDLSFHDRRGFHFLIVTRHGAIDPELAAIVNDPDTHLVPFLERAAPAPLDR